MYQLYQKKQNRTKQCGLSPEMIETYKKLDNDERKLLIYLMDLTGTARNVAIHLLQRINFQENQEKAAKNLTTIKGDLTC